jgi:phosphoserine phosphatase
MAADRFRLVTFDLDGTLTSVHGWREIARSLGRERELAESDRRFFAREIGEDAHLKNLLDLAVGCTVPELERILALTPKVAGIPETLRELRRQGVRTALLTHNPDYVCRWYRVEFGFDDAEGTTGTVLGPDGRIIDSGPARADKVAGLHRLLERWSVRPHEVAHVGDGWADATIFPRVGAGISFNSRLAEVDRAADASVRSDTLTAILPILSTLTPRRPVNDGPRSDEPSNT